MIKRPHLTEEQRQKAVALLLAGESVRNTAKKVGISSSAAGRIRKELDERDDVVVPTRDADTAASAAAVAGTTAKAVWITAEEISDHLIPLTKKALDRIEEALEPGATPNSVQVRLAQWTVERWVSSADAREQSGSADAAAERYAEVLERVTAPDPDRDAEREAIRQAQIDVVERRKPYVVNEPQREAL